jgi:type I restriction enzyme, R subunit
MGSQSKSIENYMSRIYESHIEEWVVELLEGQGYSYLAPEAQEAERGDLREVVLAGRLRAAVQRINPGVPEDVREDAIKKVLNLSGMHLIEANEEFQRMLADGVSVSAYNDGEQRGEVVRLVDFDNPRNNEFVVANQFTVPFDSSSKRPDVLLIVNGLPLAVIELKNPTDENATVHKAYTQLDNYKRAIPQLFVYNSVLVASDGIDAKAGALTSEWERFAIWRAPEERRAKEKLTSSVENIPILGQCFMGY